jgi:hypothetical protein
MRSNAAESLFWHGAGRLPERLVRTLKRWQKESEGTYFRVCATACLYITNVLWKVSKSLFAMSEYSDISRNEIYFAETRTP